VAPCMHCRTTRRLLTWSAQQRAERSGDHVDQDSTVQKADASRDDRHCAEDLVPVGNRCCAIFDSVDRSVQQVATICTGDRKTRGCRSNNSREKDSSTAPRSMKSAASGMRKKKRTAAAAGRREKN
jgi:hypothetical protein